MLSLDVTEIALGVQTSFNIAKLYWASTVILTYDTTQVDRSLQLFQVPTVDLYVSVPVLSVLISSPNSSQRNWSVFLCIFILVCEN